MRHSTATLPEFRCIESAARQVSSLGRLQRGGWRGLGGYAPWPRRDLGVVALGADVRPRRTTRQLERHLGQHDAAGLHRQGGPPRRPERRPMRLRAAMQAPARHGSHFRFAIRTHNHAGCVVRSAPPHRLLWMSSALLVPRAYRWPRPSFACRSLSASSGCRCCYPCRPRRSRVWIRWRTTLGV